MPSVDAHLGAQSFNISLDDTQDFNNYTITLTVLSNPPIYTGDPNWTYPNMTIPINSVMTQVIPAFHDPDGSDSRVSIE